MDNIYDVVIIGSGPAGLAAGIYCGRARLKTLLIEKENLGGQLINMDMIENYPGYDGGIMAPDLVTNMLNQANNTGIELEMTPVESIETCTNYTIVNTASGSCQTKALILACGSHHKKLEVPGENEFLHKGVFYCAICDGAPYSDKVVVVAGGGDAGITEALYLASIASKVIVVEAMPTCMASAVLLEKAKANPKIEMHCNMCIEKISGIDHVTEVSLRNTKSEVKSSIQADGVLVHIGVQPNTGWLKDVISLNERGQVVVNSNLETETPGIFAAGDVRANSPCQIVTAAGDGATAGISAQRYINRFK